MPTQEFKLQTYFHPGIFSLIINVKFTLNSVERSWVAYSMLIVPDRSTNTVLVDLPEDFGPGVIFCEPTFPISRVLNSESEGCYRKVSIVGMYVAYISYKWDIL
jgi:hypothetical protein